MKCYTIMVNDGVVLFSFFFLSVERVPKLQRFAHRDWLTETQQGTSLAAEPQPEDPWLPTESFPSSCLMACQHQPHYVSLNSGSEFTRRARARRRAQPHGEAGTRVLLLSSPREWNILTVETSDNYTNKVTSDTAIRHWTSCCVQLIISLFEHDCSQVHRTCGSVLFELKERLF